MFRYCGFLLDAYVRTDIKIHHPFAALIRDAENAEMFVFFFPLRRRKAKSSMSFATLR